MKYEYKRVVANHRYGYIPDEDFNELGKEGWKLIAVVPDSPPIFIYIFCRSI